MASKNKTIYICSECGFESPKWNGCCPNCGEWNTMNEEIISTVKSSKNISPINNYEVSKISEISDMDEIRFST